MIDISILEASDIELLHQLANSETISRTSSLPFPCPKNLIYEWHLENEVPNPMRISFTILRTEEVTGAGFIKKIDYQGKSAEISYWLGSKYWRQGIGKMAASKLRDYAFVHLKLQYIHAHVLRHNNMASKRILEGIGFLPDEDAKDISVEGKFKKLFPHDYWVFYKMSRSRWLEMIKSQVSSHQ